ncbi:MAG: hypothetical protein IPL05_11075 [Betaproteobacteria bacterium]|nr:hypothetical protein [Betaproteobacteria bacterium]
MIKESVRLQKPANIESPIAGTAKLLLRVESTLNALGVGWIICNVVPADAVIRKYKQSNESDSTCCGRHQKRLEQNCLEASHQLKGVSFE